METLLNAGRPFRYDQLSELGLTRTSLAALVKQAQVRKILHSVYVDNDVPDSRRLRTEAARLVMPAHGVAAGCTASWLMGVDTFAPTARLDLRPEWMVPHGLARGDRRGISVVEGYLDARDITAVDGIPVTTAARTGVDLLRRLGRPWALAAADGLAHADLVTRAELELRLPPLRGYPGIVQARELAPLVEPRAESSGESVQRLRLIDAGFPAPVPQLEIHDHAGRFVGRFDHAYEEQLVLCEHDGAAFHSNPDDVRRDFERRARVRRLGWRVAITRDDLFGIDNDFERQVGEWLGMRPRERSW